MSTQIFDRSRLRVTRRRIEKGFATATIARVPGGRGGDPRDVDQAEGATMEITIGPEELKAGKMSGAHLQAAVQAIRTEGYVVLENVVSHAHLDVLRERMDEDSRKLIDVEKWGGAGQIKGHLQQGPP